MTIPGPRTTLTDAVRRSLENAVATAEQNIKYLTEKSIPQKEREIAAAATQIKEWLEEVRENEATLAQANEMLDV